jgi:hypothetical protein
MPIRNFIVISLVVILTISTTSIAQQSARISANCNLKPSSKTHKIFIPPPSQHLNGEKTSEFDLTFVNATVKQEAAVRYAADIWCSIIVSEVPIKVIVTFYPMDNFLGQCVSNMTKNFPWSPQQDTWFVSSLADAMTGIDQLPDEYDMDIFITSLVDWYEDLDGNCPASKFDLASTVLHEMGHGLGYFGLGFVQNGIGSYGHVPGSVLVRPIAFDFPDLEGLTTNYDAHVVNSAYKNSTDTLLFPNPSQKLNDLFVSQDLYFDGESAVAANDNKLVKLFAPGAFHFGSSLLHLDEATFPPGNINTLMTASVSFGESVHNPGPITIGLFQDLGWTINDSITVDVNNEDAHPAEFMLAQNYPNPFNPETRIEYTIGAGQAAGHENITIRVYDILGNELATLVNEQKAPGSYYVKFDGSSFASGVYIYKLSAGSFTQHHKMSLLK